MNGTDELRGFANSGMSAMECSAYSDKLIAIADRIDAEHERLMEERADRYAELRASLKERYVELPKDADNVPWSVGDRDEDGNDVIALKLASDGWYVMTVGEWPYRPERHRHHHAPTVEDVLREFANEVYADADNEIRDRDFLCAKYAKRLTLAETEDA